MDQKEKTFRVLSWIAEIAFCFCLLAEIVFAHSLVSQASMLVFFGCTALLVLQRKHLYFSWWMIVSAVLILWSAIVSFGWAMDRAVSMDMVKTLIITTVFFSSCFNTFFCGRICGGILRFM